jgi:hypothetical protein
MRRTHPAPLHYTLLFSRHPGRLSIFALILVPDPPSLVLVGTSFACLLAERTPSHPFSFSLTQARIGSAPWRCCFPPRVPLVIPLHAASISDALRHHPRPPGYKCHLACLSFIPPRIQSRARRVNPFRLSSGGKSREAVGKEVVGGRATRSSSCSQI